MKGKVPFYSVIRFIGITSLFSLNNSQCLYSVRPPVYYLFMKSLVVHRRHKERQFFVFKRTIVL